MTDERADRIAAALERIATALENAPAEQSPPGRQPADKWGHEWYRETFANERLGARARKVLWRLMRDFRAEGLGQIPALIASNDARIARNCGETTYREIIEWMKLKGLEFRDGLPSF